MVTELACLLVIFLNTYSNSYYSANPVEKDKIILQRQKWSALYFITVLLIYIANTWWYMYCIPLLKSQFEFYINTDILNIHVHVYVIYVHFFLLFCGKWQKLNEKHISNIKPYFKRKILQFRWFWRGRRVLKWVRKGGGGNEWPIKALNTCVLNILNWLVHLLIWKKTFHHM
jgi:hypothetical protein